jgi:succinoglycan biosynthesis transport protein ExoP
LLLRPTYTALSKLAIDVHKNSTGQQQTILGDPISDSAVVESQVEVVRSEVIARAVIKQLNLTQDTEFSREPRSSERNYHAAFTSIFFAGVCADTGDSPNCRQPLGDEPTAALTEAP